MSSPLIYQISIKVHLHCFRLLEFTTIPIKKVSILHALIITVTNSLEEGCTSVCTRSIPKLYNLSPTAGFGSVFCFDFDGTLELIKEQRYHFWWIETKKNIKDNTFYTLVINHYLKFSKNSLYLSIECDEFIDRKDIRLA